MITKKVLPREKEKNVKKKQNASKREREPGVCPQKKKKKGKLLGRIGSPSCRLSAERIFERSMMDQKKTAQEQKTMS